MSYPGPPQQPDPWGGQARPGEQPASGPAQPGYGQPGAAQPGYGQPGAIPPAPAQWASPGQGTESDVPAIPQAPTTQPAPQTPLGQSPYGRHAPVEQHAQGSFGQFTFPVMKRRPLEPTAVAAVATSPLGPVGLFLGLFARRQVKATQRRSPALAGTGIGLGALFTVLWVLAAVVLAGNGTIARWTERPEPGDVAEARTVAASNVAVGNCIEFLPPGQSVGELRPVPCAQDHAAQAITTHDLDGDFPGVDALSTQARNTCQEDVSAVVSDVPVMVWYLAPSEQAWAQGTQQILCLARAQAGTMTGDLVNG